VNADHRGGWTQIFGGKASEHETSWPVDKRNFYILLLRRNLLRDLLRHITIVLWLSCSVVCVILCLAVLAQLRLVTDRQKNRQTDGRTDTRWQQIPHSLASRR